MNKAAGVWTPHSAHWGAFSARWNGTTLDITPYEGDPAPSPILQNFSTALRHKARVLRPMVRKAWLDRSTLSGQVKVTSATADEISGDIDLTAGDNTIKGSFTAKVLKRS